MSLNESIIEEAALEWFAELGYAVVDSESPITPCLKFFPKDSKSP